VDELSLVREANFPPTVFCRPWSLPRELLLHDGLFQPIDRPQPEFCPWDLGTPLATGPAATRRLRPSSKGNNGRRQPSDPASLRPTVVKRRNLMAVMRTEAALERRSRGSAPTTKAISINLKPYAVIIRRLGPFFCYTGSLLVSRFQADSPRETPKNGYSS
jgi:hypothetical protein